MKTMILDWLQLLGCTFLETSLINADALTLEDNGRAVFVCFWKGIPRYLESINAWMPSDDGACLGKLRSDAFLANDIKGQIPMSEFKNMIVNIKEIKEKRVAAYENAKAVARDAFQQAGIPFVGISEKGISPETDGVTHAVSTFYQRCSQHLREKHLKSSRFNTVLPEFKIIDNKEECGFHE